MAMTAGEFVYLIRADKSQLNKTLGESEKETKAWGNKLSSWTIAKGQMIGQFATKAIMKVNDITRAVVSNTIKAYGRFEQLESGAELLFGAGYKKIMDNAAKAYATVQMSANEYLEAVNGYAVGLKNSLGNDEQAAADLADKIITAQADVVAATGKSREAVQNAFAGVMRGNYMMLDNLGLGIKGSKEGMEDVIKAVNEWNKSMNRATKYQIGNLADMEKALVDYVEMQGLAGYAGEEASKTIEGTIASTKAAWENLLVAFGSGKDVKTATRNLADSAKKMLKNLLPVAKNTIQSIGDFVVEMIPEIGKWVTQLADELKKSPNPVVAWLGNTITDIETKIRGVDNLINHFPETVEALKSSDDPFKQMLGGALDTGYKALTWIKDNYKTVEEGIKVIGGAFLGWKIEQSVMDAINFVKRFFPSGDRDTKYSPPKQPTTEPTSEPTGDPYPAPLPPKNEPKPSKFDNLKRKVGDLARLIYTYDPFGSAALIPEVAGDYTVLGSTIKKSGGFKFEAIAKAYEEAIPKAMEKAASKWSEIPNQVWTASGNMAGLFFNFLKGEKGGDWSTASGDDWSVPVKVEPEVPKEAPQKISKDIGTVTVPVKFSVSGIFGSSGAGGAANGLDPIKQAFFGSFYPHAKGLWTVPYDNYPILAHRGEQLLTASQARQSGGEVDYGYISQMIGDSLERALNRVNVLLDGGKVGDMTTRRTNKNIRKHETAVLHGMGG